MDKHPDDLLVWVDTETSGLDPADSRLLEVAAIVTTPDLDQVGEPFTATVRYTAEQVADLRAAADPFVVRMHDNNGIWDSLTSGDGTTPQVDELMLDWLSALCPEPKRGRIAGNSIRLDMNFMDVYLPRTMEHLTYRSVDVSAMHFILNHWLDLDEDPKAVSDHTALADIRASIAELAFLREKMREVPLP